MTQGGLQIHNCDVLSGKNVIQSHIPEKTTLVSHVAVQWEQPFVPARVLSITPRMRAIDRFSRLRH